MIDSERGERVELYEDYELVQRCLECGADETDEPGVVVEREEPDSPKLGESLLPQFTTEFECRACGNEEVIGTGQLASISAETFGLTYAPIDEEMPVVISGTQIDYKEIEEYRTESALYNRAGPTATSTMQQVRIQAFDPPTFSKGNAYDVQIGDFFEQRMLLTGIKYYTRDDPWRLLSFSRKLDGGIIDMAEDLGGDMAL